MKIMLEIEDRVRKDSTCMYFKRAFEKICDVVSVYPEEVPYIRPGFFQLHIRIDYGIDNRSWPVDLHPSAYYAIDTHIDPEWRVKMAAAAKYDYIFCAQMPGTKLNWHTDKVSWLPLACDPDIHKPKGTYSKLHDVCFVGSVQPGWQERRVKRLDKLFKAIPNYYFGNVFFEEVAKKYAQSRIVFNSAYSNDINMRVFEALCSGSCLLTDKQDWQGLLLNHEVDFIEYTDDDMVDKARYLLKNEERRELLAKQGQAMVLNRHTYLHRAEELLKKCGL